MLLQDTVGSLSEQCAGRCDQMNEESPLLILDYFSLLKIDTGNA